jgi:hypothetical protein
MSQRESLLQWEAESMTIDELALPAKHLRACDISDSSEDLCMSQHVNAFSVTLPQRVAESAGLGVKPGIENFKSKIEYFEDKGVLDDAG